MNVQKCNRKANGFFALTVGVASSGSKVPNKRDLFANQRALEVKETTWEEGAGGAAGAKSMWELGSKDVRVACVEDAVTTWWGFVDCDVTLYATVVVILRRCSRGRGGLWMGERCGSKHATINPLKE